MLTVQQLTDVGVAMFPPVADWPVQRTVNRSVGWDVRMDEVSVLSWPVCVSYVCCECKLAYCTLLVGSITFGVELYVPWDAPEAGNCRH